MTEWYPWIVLLHIVGAFVFIVAHSVSAWVVNSVGRQTEAAAVATLVRLSELTITTAYVGLLLLLVGGIWAGLVGGWFGRGWIWAAIAVLVLVMVGMYAIAVPYFKRLRIALGQRVQGMPRDAPDPERAPDADILTIARQAPTTALNAIGISGLLAILWLMVVKPF